VGKASSWGALHIERVDGCDAAGRSMVKGIKSGAL
jgi:hypothetical protein